MKRFEQDYREALDELRFSEDAKGRMIGSLMEQKEEKFMKKRNIRPLRAGLIAAAVAVAVLCGTAWAAQIFLRPAQVSEQFSDYTLSAAFDGEDAISINASATSGGYTFTLLGMVSGEGISDFGGSAVQVQPERTYVVLAIRNADGTPISEDDAFYLYGQFMVTPLIQGMEPWRYNAASMGGSASEALVDGVLYHLTECDSIMTLADRKLYLGVCDSTFVMNDTFRFDETTGEIAVNPDYAGASAVFELPIDPSFADPERAEEYLNQLREKMEPDSFAPALTEGQLEATDPHEPRLAPEAGDTDPYEPEMPPEVQEWFDRIREARDNADWESMVPVEDSYRELSIDADGYLRYDYPLEDGVNNAGFTTLAELIFDQFDQGETEIYLKNVTEGSTDTGDIEITVYAVRLTKIDDNTVAAVMVVPE